MNRVPDAFLLSFPTKTPIVVAYLLHICYNMIKVRSHHRRKGSPALNTSFVLKGNICHTPAPDDLEVLEQGVVVCEGGVCRGAFDAVPERFAGLEVVDCGDRLILPGLVDLHTHAPQYAFCGTGMDYELMEWLNQVAFPEEARYADAAYAEKAYGIFAQKLKEGATTRAVIFGTMHADATLTLMDLMERSGLISLVGKVNMDRNAPAELTEPGAEQAAADTRRFIEACRKRGYQRTGPIVTPRFVPSCTDALMERLGAIRRAYDLPVQSHLSENPGEVELVRKLAPEAAFYGDAYDRFGLFGRDSRTVMAHCVYSTPEEVQRMLDNGVWVAHCPSSNMNIASGIAPVRRYMEAGLRIGLGTDVAGGSSISMFRAVTDCIQVSKMYWRYVDKEAKPLTFPEALFLATKGGGSFFGNTGSFEDGSAFDAIVLNDSAEPRARDLSVAERLERAFYWELDRSGITMKFVRGERVL